MIQIQEYLSGHSEKSKSLKRSTECGNCKGKNCKACKTIYNLKIIKDTVIIYDTILTDIDFLKDKNIFNIKYRLSKFPKVFYLNLCNYLESHNIKTITTTRNSFCICTSLDKDELNKIIKDIADKLDMKILSIDKI